MVFTIEKNKCGDTVTIEQNANGKYEIAYYDANACMRTTDPEQYKTMLLAYVAYMTKDEIPF